MTMQSESWRVCPIGAGERRQEAFQHRVATAAYQRSLPLPGHPSNGDEEAYPNKIGSHSKGLPHNQLGEVSQNAYTALLRALSTGDPDAFEDMPLGGVVRLVDPQAAYAFEMAGPDSHHLSIPPAPAFASAQIASEMAEAYWQALTRDVPFADFDSHLLALAAASDLTGFSDFRGPKVDGKVTTGTLFRGETPGDLSGPYVSQFLWWDIPFGATTVAQRYRITVAGVDYLTSYQEWLRNQNGLAPVAPSQFDPVPRHIRNGRDLGEWVHRDFSYQCVLGACLILLGLGPDALAPSNPYLHSATQVGFSTFGAPHILDCVARAVRAGLEAAWFQKFLVHRRLRPEEFGGRVQNLMAGNATYPINQELLESQAVANTFRQYGTYLLPSAFPEGCPAHPAYPSGHATYTGAGVTMLKAFFNESFVLPNPVAASRDGLALLPYTGEPLTVGGELNKLASNIALGRNAAGVHWRTDAVEGMKLGEAVAIGVLQDYRQTFSETFSGFSFTKFDGTNMTI